LLTGARSRFPASHALVFPVCESFPPWKKVPFGVHDSLSIWTYENYVALFSSGPKARQVRQPIAFKVTCPIRVLIGAYFVCNDATFCQGYFPSSSDRHFFLIPVSFKLDTLTAFYALLVFDTAFQGPRCLLSVPVRSVVPRPRLVNRDREEEIWLQ